LSHIEPGTDPQAPIEVPTDEQAAVAAAGFAMLGDPTRLKLLWLLSHGEHDVATLAGLARTTPPIASQHLAKLRLAGLVTLRPDGKRRVYSIKGAHMRTLIQEALFHADHHVSGIEHHT
jgi:DNA-binding transcriptional ArsR family regulator